MYLCVCVFLFLHKCVCYRSICTPDGPYLKSKNLPLLALQSVLETMRGMSPSVVRQVAPLLEQLAPIYLDLAQGRMEFSPSPEEARQLMQTYYSEYALFAAVKCSCYSGCACVVTSSSSIRSHITPKHVYTHRRAPQPAHPFQERQHRRV